jgi:hypothetical protein
MTNLNNNRNIRAMETVKVQGGKDYAMVVERVKEFNSRYPDGQILTEIVSNIDGVVIFKAHAVVNGVILGTGHAQEREGSSNINKTSHIECAETSAIGRCLAFGIGLMPDGSIASYEEIETAKIQQAELGEKERLFTLSTELLSQQLWTAIEGDDEEGILEVIKDVHGNQPLRQAVWKTLTPEHAEYMEERRERLWEERKAKSEAKDANNLKLAKEFAKKEKAK